VLKIRKYEEKDFPSYVATLERTTNFGKDAEKELKAMLAKVDRNQIWVSEKDGKAVGFMILTVNDDGSLEVDWLDIHPSHQRKGVGTLLMKKATEIAKKKGISSLSVHTSLSNDKMIKFLIKNKFKTVERIKDFYGEGKDALHTRRIIMMRVDRNDRLM
jgi:ribosomal protein S18 acetylase RimI-like enzyme